MPLTHSDVTATVSIDGLALGCYNRDTDTYEVGFIHDDNHVLALSITTPTVGEETATIKFTLDKNHRVFIDTEEGIAPAEPFFTTENFDRTTQPNQDNDEDFQWILDLDKDLNNNQPVPLIHAAVPSMTETRISKPMLYANNRRFVNGVLNLVNQQDKDDKRLFGNLCEAIKGDIKCAEGGAVVVRIEGPLRFSYRLPRIAGKTHQIVMENLCPSAAVGQPGFRSDFTLVYTVVQDTSGKKFDLKLVDDSHVPDGVCNQNNLGKTGKLFP
jgi:hypothetical protein